MFTSSYSLTYIRYNLVLRQVLIFIQTSVPLASSTVDQRACRKQARSTTLLQKQNHGVTWSPLINHVVCTDRVRTYKLVFYIMCILALPPGTSFASNLFSPTQCFNIVFSLSDLIGMVHSKKKLFYF